MLRIVQSIPSPRAEPVKRFLARAGAERLEEIAESDILAGLTTEQRAIFLRGQMADRNHSLAEAAETVGVVTNRDFAFFQDFGYLGLYNGERARDIAKRKGLAKGLAILVGWGPTSSLLTLPSGVASLYDQPSTHRNACHSYRSRAARITLSGAS